MSDFSAKHHFTEFSEKCKKPFSVYWAQLQIGATWRSFLDGILRLGVPKNPLKDLAILLPVWVPQSKNDFSFSNEY